MDANERRTRMGASPLVSVHIETFLRFHELRLGGYAKLTKGIIPKI